MNYDHKDAACPHCVPAKNQIPNQSKLGAGLHFAPQADKSFGEKLRAFLGVCGCISCYIAMFPALLLSVIGILGLSQSSTASALNAYMASALFQPILIVSIIFLVVGILRYGKLPLWLSILGGIGIFTSMNFYMREWLFTLSFGMLALAYYLAFRKTKTQQLKIALVLLLAVMLLGVIDVTRSTLGQNIDNRTMDMMNMP